MATEARRRAEVRPPQARRPSRGQRSRRTFTEYRQSPTEFLIPTGGHGTYGAREKQRFANALDRVLAKALRG
jgi:hypothetical protein